MRTMLSNLHSPAKPEHYQSPLALGGQGSNALVRC